MTFELFGLELEYDEEADVVRFATHEPEPKRPSCWLDWELTSPHQYDTDEEGDAEAEGIDCWLRGDDA